MCLSKRVLERTYRIWAVFGDFGEGFSKWGFTLEGMFSGSGIIRYFPKSYLERGKTRMRLKL